MAKQALLEVLESTIGKYVKDLDAENLNLGIWNGQVELNSLELNVDAVNAELERQAEDAPNLSLPFRVTRGSFGSFSIDVPWSRLMSQPVVLRAHGLTVSVEAHERHEHAADFLRPQSDNFDDFKREKKILEARIKSLLLANDNRLRKKAVADLAGLDIETSKNTSGSSTFSSRLVRRIIENIQVEVNHVHVSLESGDCTAGVVMESLTLFTTDARGKKSFVDRTSGDHKLANSFLHKKLNIIGLAVYLDEDDSIFHSLRSVSEYSNEDTATHSATDSNHTYILAPLSFEATLRQADSNVCIDYPKYLLTSKLPTLSVILTKSQLEFSSRVAGQVRLPHNEIKPLFPEYRPIRRVTKETAAEWWRYAFRCVGRLSGRKGWNEFLIAYRQRKLYIPLYKRDSHHSKCHWLEPLTPKELSQLQVIESNRSISIDGIMAWRSIADAQFEKEQEKFDATKQAKKKGATRSFFFGTSETASSTEADHPPITLTVDEMKELESNSMSQIAEDELSNDSKLCSIHFVLGSFKVNLTSRDLRPVASFHMGRVSSAFKANADGSFVFGLKVSSLDIADMVTPRSLYPNVLSSLKKDAHPEGDGIFTFNLSKTKEGGQKLSCKLVSFQAVASPSLLKEVRDFFTLSAAPRRFSTVKKNPILAKSLSGSVDLFYDADEGREELLQPTVLTAANESAQQNTENPSAFSNALIEAWKAKTETKASWVVDLDIRAPILVLPENCVDSAANVMILDLGHLRFQYGNIDDCPEVVTWFKQHPKGDGTDPVVDKGNLAVTHLTFMVTETALWHKALAQQGSADASIQREAIVEPISVSFDFAVESVSSSAFPRGCAIGVVPSIVLRLSPAQASKSLNVYNAWIRLIQGSSQSTNDETNPLDGDLSDGMEGLISSVEQEDNSVMGMDNSVSSKHSREGPFSVFHFQIWLQRLSVLVDFDEEGGVDSHLVSVNASFSSMSDGSSVSNISMGWFWILDRFSSSFVRKQRLFVHSDLPLSPHLVAVDEKYAILEELEKHGAFRERSSGATDLANITYKQFGIRSGGSETTNEFMASHPFNGGRENGRIDAKFSSLFIHWNPQGVKTLTTMLGRFNQYLEVSNNAQQDPILVIAAGSEPTRPQKRHSNGIAGINARQFTKATGAGTLFVINAEMKSFEIFLNSARDDLPLFVLAMSRAKISTLSSSEGDLLVSLALGDFRLGTPLIGETRSDYRTLLGLAPAQTESLLSAKYWSGPRAMQGAILQYKDLEKCEAFTDIELSPMRMVYIHAQVLALVEYVSEGILGAIFAQAASSAVAAAADMATASYASKLYHVKATSFDFILPQSARSPRYIGVHAGELNVAYKSFVEPGGSEASVTLSEVSLRDNTSQKMQKEPIRLEVAIKLPSTDVGNVEDQAMQVDVTISSASFLISKSQYGQIMLTLDYNLCEYDLFLRDGDADSGVGQSFDSEDGGEVQLGSITHAGVAEVIIPRRMYVRVKISVLSLELFAAPLQPLVRLAAVDAFIDFRTLFDQTKKWTQVTLGNLVCDDQRQKAVKRQYQSLVYQVKRGSSGDVAETLQDVFYISYESMDNGDTSYDIKIGSPRIVYVPDIVSEIMSFITVEGRFSTETLELPTTATVSTDCHVDEENISVGVDDGNGGVEVSLQSRANASVSEGPLATMSVSVSTSRCSMVLVDLGGDLSSIGSPRSSQLENQVIENLVLEGKCASKFVLKSSKVTGETTNQEVNIHGDSLEAYTAFGRDMRSALQILDPAGFSVVLSKTPQRFELRAATLTPINVCFSMRNYALISALLGGLGFTDKDDSSQSSSNDDFKLSDQDANRIERLASKLNNETSDGATSVRTMDSMRVSESFFRADSDTGNKSNLTYALSIKITMPEANITVVNDLQGLDDALFRLSIINFVCGGELRTWLAPSPGSQPLTTFDCHVHTSLQADYFDSSVNVWKKLLSKPWELSLRGARGASKRFESSRLSSTFDLESFPCSLAFSEQFVVSIAAASRMWSIYSVATSSTASLLKEVNTGDAHDSIAERSAAASAARNLITTLPYALENHFGVDVEYKVAGHRADRRRCPSGTIQYFRFEPPPGRGYGGERLYGQDVLYKKSLQLFIGDAVITIDDLDSEAGKERRAHLAGNSILFTTVVKEGKARVVHLSSSVNMVNFTSIPLEVSLMRSSSWKNVGVCEPADQIHGTSQAAPMSTFSVNDGIMSKSSNGFGIPVGSLDEFLNSWRENGAVDIVMKVTPKLSDWVDPNPVALEGRIDLHGVHNILLQTESNSVRAKFDVLCRSISRPGRGQPDAFVLQVTADLCLIDGVHLFIDIGFEPRSVVVNNIPTTLSIRTPMPHTFSSLCQHDNRESIHEVQPGGRIEVYTPGPSIAINVKCSDLPIAGTPMGWMETWVDLPMTPEFGLLEPLRCVFPFQRKKDAALGWSAAGCEFFISDGNTIFSEWLSKVQMQKQPSGSEAFGLELRSPSSNVDSQRRFSLSICNYAIDHTGNILLEQFHGFESAVVSQPFSTFVSSSYQRRISLLPRSMIPLRLLHLTMEGEEGIRRTLPFKIDNIAICDGGISSTLIPWEDNTPSGYFLYRKLISTDQSELHIIPEYVVFNGSEHHSMHVQQPGIADIIISPGKIKPVWIKDREAGLILSLEYADIGGVTPPLRVDNLGLRVAVLKSFEGFPLGSIAIQTVIGARDSRFVVKIGDIKRSSLEDTQSTRGSIVDLKRDFLRFRIQASELELTLMEYTEILEACRRPSAAVRSNKANLGPRSHHQEKPVCTVLLQRFTIDWQRVFKDDTQSSAQSLRRSVLLSPERSQLSVVCHSILVRDESMQSSFPIVFNSTSTASFLDLCIRIRGPLDSDLIKVDLFDLNFSQINGVPQKMFLNTSEDFLWKLLDLADRISSATGELASAGMKLTWDVQHGGFSIEEDAASDNEANYTPPRTSSIYDVNKTRVSPFTLILTFKRNPQASRYAKSNSGQIVKYFTQRLKFKIENADLTFGSYETNNLKGPPDRIVEILQAVYLSRIKMRLVAIMSAASFQDWKSLASRNNGEESFVEGDLVRVTGNLAANTANMMLKNVGKGLGKGVQKVTHSVGNSFENATGKVGARALGAGVNSIITGVGDGIGDGIQGVGNGLGKSMQGVGKGAGQVLGGVTGGMLLVGKGIGQGVTRGDGKALVSGVSQGINSVGTGLGQGVGTVGQGVADGVLSVGKGLFSGVRSVGKGFGGAFTGKKNDGPQ